MMSLMEKRHRKESSQSSTGQEITRESNDQTIQKSLGNLLLRVSNMCLRNIRPLELSRGERKKARTKACRPMHIEGIRDQIICEMNSKPTTAPQKEEPCQRRTQHVTTHQTTQHLATPKRKDPLYLLVKSCLPYRAITTLLPQTHKVRCRS